jgi:antitoxin PrlF
MNSYNLSMKMRATVSERGQVTIPKRLRTRLGIRAGQLLEFHEETESGRMIVQKVFDEDPLAGLFGILKSDGRSTDEIIEELRGHADLP